MVVCFFMYILAGFIKTPWIPLAIGLVLVVVGVYLMSVLEKNRTTKKGTTN
jgi:hypothetical protein